MPPWTGLAVILALIPIGLVVRRRLAVRHVLALRGLAARMGLTYSSRGGDVHAKYECFHPMGMGRGRVSDHLICGQRGRVTWDVFDYHFVSDSGKQRVALRYAVAAATVPATFERTTIRPEGLLDRFVASAGFDDINFESEQFNRRFHVSSRSRSFAHALLHAQAMELLLGRPARHWQLDGSVILIHEEGKFDARELEETIKLVEDFVAMIPAYLRIGAETNAR